MWQSDYQYYAALSLPDGGKIGEVRLDIDWIPALRWAEFERYQKDCLVDKCPAPPVIEPIWEPEGAHPYIGGALIRPNGECADGISFPLNYFAAAISRASTQLVSSGTLAAGQKFGYKIYALADKQSRVPADSGVDIVALDQPPSVELTELAPLLAELEMESSIGSVERRTSSQTVAETMPILVPQFVLDEATALGQEVGDVETGGILVGKLYRDSSGILFSRVTAQIPAEHTTATRESLRFSHATWASVDAAIKLRSQDEIPLGWWHTHPDFCHRCSPTQRALCPLSVPMFSAADRDLHREVFQKPWSIGLLLSFLGAEEPSYDIFAWNKGQIEAVNFFILPGETNNTGESP